MNKSLDLELRNEVMCTMSKYMDSIKLLKVDHIGYREFHEDGSSIAFCSNEAWYELVLDEEMTRDMSTHYAQELMLIKKNNFNCIIRAASCANNRFLRELLMRDMCNSLLVYKREKGIIKMYSFIASNSNISALNFFFNKHQLFELVVNSYKDELANVLQKKEYQPLRQPLFCAQLVSDIFNQEEIMVDKNNNHSLTPRESEYIPLLANGATNKDLAAWFKISARTAQYHVNNIKRKLKVASRYNIPQSIKVQLNDQNVL
jgi:DNA-binding CsgD family transcriptional regulator